MKKYKLLTAVFLLIGLISCGNNENSTTTTEPDQTTSAPTTVDMRTDLEKITDLITTLKETTNYTMSINDSDGDWVRKYVPNAYYYYAPDTYASIDNIGYAENETGIFAYKHDNEGINFTSSYYRDENKELIHGLYTAKTLVSSWDTIPVNFANSFELFDTSKLNNLKESAVPGMYTIDSTAVIPLLPQMHQQNYYNPKTVSTRIGLKSYGLLIQFHGSWVDYDLKVYDIGSTSIDFIEAFLAEGNGPSLEDDESSNDTTKLQNLLTGLNYRVTKNDTTTYIVTSDYVLVSEYDEATSTENLYGLIKIPENNIIETEAGIYKFTINASNNVVLSEKTSYESIEETYYAIPGDILDACTWSETDYVYLCESMITLLRYTPYFEEMLLEEGNYIGKLYISYSLLEGQMAPYSTITLHGEHYSSETGKANGNTTTLSVSAFNSVDNNEIASPVINFLDIIKG